MCLHVWSPSSAFVRPRSLSPLVACCRSQLHVAEKSLDCTEREANPPGSTKSYAAGKRGVDVSDEGVALPIAPGSCMGCEGTTTDEPRPTGTPLTVCHKRSLPPSLPRVAGRAVSGAFAVGGVFSCVLREPADEGLL